jgi:hypothetical protein
MAYALVEDVAASWERYASFDVAPMGRPPAGLILHAAGPTDEGFRIIELWESQDAWRRFGERTSASGVASLPRFVRVLVPTHVVVGPLPPSSAGARRRSTSTRRRDT